VKALVTGSDGFIGSVIARKLAEQGHEVTGVDIKSGTDARDFFREDHARCDLAVHCAAVVGGRILVETPLAHAENLEIDAGLFQWAERTRPGRIVYISSVAAYPVRLQQQARTLSPVERELQDALSTLAGEPAFSHKVITLPPRSGRLQETDISLARPDLPDKTYGWAKLTGEMLAAQFGVPVSVVRPFTVYGEGQDPVFPFANMIQQVRERRDPVTVWGTGAQVRDFIHVDDVADAILTMAGRGIDGPVNLCTGRGVRLSELAAMMAWQADYIPQVQTIPDKPEGLPYRVGDPARLHEFYIPRISLEQGIERGLR
jgi:nucleoside-diphosphate-sugar epimerase